MTISFILMQGMSDDVQTTESLPQTQTQTQTSQPEPSNNNRVENKGTDWSFFFPFILIIVVFYFFMIRPQMKKQKELKTYRNSLEKGDKIVTTGGIYGKISSISENTVDVEIAHGIVIKVDKFAVLKDSTDLANQK